MKKIIIGPHHGAYSLNEELEFIGLLNIEITNIGYIDNDEPKGEHDYIHTEDVLPYLKSHLNDDLSEEDLDWGWFTTIHIGDIDEWGLNLLISSIKKSYIKTFLYCSGDDDTYDYMPSYTSCLEQLLRCLIAEAADPLIKNIRFICYMTTRDLNEAKNLEFFSDEEILAYEEHRLE